ERGLQDRAEQAVLVEGLAAIHFTVADSADPIEVEGETTYEIRVVNQGSKEATNVQVVVLLPADMEPMDATGPARYTFETGRVTFATLGRLAPKADVSFHVKVRAHRSGDQRVRVQVATDEIQAPVVKEESTRVYADE